MRVYRFMEKIPKNTDRALTLRILARKYNEAVRDDLTRKAKNTDRALMHRVLARKAEGK